MDIVLREMNNQIISIHMGCLFFSIKKILKLSSLVSFRQSSLNLYGIPAWIFTKNKVKNLKKEHSEKAQFSPIEEGRTHDKNVIYAAP